MPTMMATFGGGIPLVDLDNGSAIPCGLVFQLPHQFRPSDIADGFGKAVVLDHILDCKALDAYDLVLAYELGRELVLVISSSIGNPFMKACHFETSLISILGTFFLLRMPSLRSCQFLFVFGKVLGVVIGLSLGGDDHAFESQIKPDHLWSHRQGFDLFFHQDRHKVTVGFIFGDGDGRRLGIFGQGTRPDDSERLLHLGKGEVCSIPLESRDRVLSRLQMAFLLEAGVIRSPLEEVTKGFIQMTKGLLRRNARYLIEPRGFRLLLEDGQGSRGVVIRNAPLLLIVGIGTQTQCPVIDVATTPKGPSKKSLLLVGRVDSILVCAFLFHSSHTITYCVKSQQRREGGIPPRHE